LGSKTWSGHSGGRAHHDSVRLEHARLYFADNHLIVMPINNLLFFINKWNLGLLFLFTEYDFAS
jgi:hypothetical protein